MVLLFVSISFAQEWFFSLNFSFFFKLFTSRHYSRWHRYEWTRASLVPPPSDPCQYFSKVYFCIFVFWSRPSCYWHRYERTRAALVPLWQCLPLAASTATSSSLCVHAYSHNPATQRLVGTPFSSHAQGTRHTHKHTDKDAWHKTKKQDLFLHVRWPSCSETLLKWHFQPLPNVIVSIYICLNVANWTSFIWVCVFPQHLWKGADQAGEDFSDNLMKGGGRLKLKIKLVKIENFHGTPKLQGYWGCHDISHCIVCTYI